MSEITRNSQNTSLALDGDGAALTELSASKDLHRKTGTNTSTLTETAPIANDSDLAIALISTTNVPRIDSPVTPSMPSTPLIDNLTGTTLSQSNSGKLSPGRIISTTNSTTKTSTERSHSPKNKQSKGAQSKQRFGVFKNPAYEYSGGLISKIFDFFANLIKVLEQIILRLIGARDVTFNPQSNQLKSTRDKHGDNNSTELRSQEQEAQLNKRKREKLVAQQKIHRS